MIITFTLNGKTIHLDANPSERLVHILRHRFKLLAAKEGCLTGRCGACTVLLDGKPVPSCLLPVFQIKNCSIETLEHFKQKPEYDDIKQGFQQAHVHLCGFCDAGKILLTHDLLERISRPTREDINLHFSGAQCRCTEIFALTEGIRKAAEHRRRRLHAK